MTTLRRAVGPAVWALRTYAWPAVWLAVAGAVALAVALPVMAGATRLGFATVRAADIGIEWTSLVIPPAVTQHRAVTELSGLLVDLAVTVLVAAYALIGLAPLYRRTIAVGAAAGLLLALAIWVIGQNFGALYTGQATDPNTAPLIAVMAVALLAGYRRPREFVDRLWRRT